MTARSLTRYLLNAASKIYHCAGSALYGTTKDGKYISEKDARAQGKEWGMA